MIEIDPRGLVYPCYQFLVNNVDVGNIRKENLFDIYYSSPKLEEIRSHTVDADPTCMGCRFKYLCGGGCIAKKDDEQFPEYCETTRDLYNWLFVNTQNGKIEGKMFPGK